MQDQAAEREVYVGVFVYAPVALGKVAVHSLVDVKHEALGVADGLVAGAVKDVGLGNLDFLGLDKSGLYNVLDFFDCGNRMGAPSRQQ